MSSVERNQSFALVPTDDKTDAETGTRNKKETCIDKKNKICWICIALIIFVVICAIITVSVIMSEKTSEGKFSELAVRHPAGCKDPTKFIKPDSMTCKGNMPCFVCREEIPSVGHRDSTDGAACESYDVTDDGRLLCMNYSFTEEEVSDGKRYPPEGSDKKYHQKCCILKLMRSKNKECPEGYVYKCFSQNSVPQCLCENGRICEGNGTMTVPCKCFWTSCKFVEEDKLENCSSTTKDPDFDKCILQYHSFKCQCKNETAEKTIPLCYTFRNEN